MHFLKLQGNTYLIITYSYYNVNYLKCYKKLLVWLKDERIEITFKGDIIHFNNTIRDDNYIYYFAAFKTCNRDILK